MQKHTSSQESFEEPVTTRFSFANRESLRQDTYVREGLLQRRKIGYLAIASNRPLADAMEEKGLLLGKKVTSISEDQEYTEYVIPTSARPIKYDVSQEGQGQLSYSDSELFTDLGNLLGSLAKEGGEKPIVFSRDAVDNIAIKGFTRPKEPKVFFVPGFETNIKQTESMEAALNESAIQLYEGLGERFERHANEFVASFRAAVAV